MILVENVSFVRDFGVRDGNELILRKDRHSLLKLFLVKVE